MRAISGSDSIFRNMMVLKDNRTKRVSSWDRTGGNKDWVTLEAGERMVLADIEGPGIINHFYVTMGCADLLHYRKLVLRMWWDDEETPSVEVPIGDFFGVPFAQPQFFQSLLLSVNPGSNRSSTEGLNAYFPMPFARRARIELENDSDLATSHFWYHINYENTKSLEPDLGYFHARWNRENPCAAVRPEGSTGDTWSIHDGINLTGNENFVILDAKGRGNYAGCILQVDNLTSKWYGEGDDMIFIDGEKWPPSLHGTGTEEIFGGGACPNEPYFTPYCGFLQVADPKFKGRNAMYKFFVNDPVRFSESIRVTIEHGHANNLGNDYASVAYWYQEEPHARFSPLPPAGERLPRLPEGCAEALKLFNDAARLAAELNKSARPETEDKRKELGRLRADCRKAFAALDFEGFMKISRQLADLGRELAPRKPGVS